MASALKLSWHLGKFLIISKMQNQSSGGGVPASLLKDRLWRNCFPLNFARLLRAPFYIENLQWPLLKIVNFYHSVHIKTSQLICTAL